MGTETVGPADLTFSQRDKRATPCVEQNVEVGRVAEDITPQSADNRK